MRAIVLGSTPFEVSPGCFSRVLRYKRTVKLMWTRRTGGRAKERAPTVRHRRPPLPPRHHLLPRFREGAGYEACVVQEDRGTRRRHDAGPSRGAPDPRCVPLSSPPSLSSTWLRTQVWSAMNSTLRTSQLATCSGTVEESCRGTTSSRTRSGGSQERCVVSLSPRVPRSC